MHSTLTNSPYYRNTKSKMDVQSDFMEPATPVLDYDSIHNRYTNNEDSGYHTSFTPGSFQYSEIFNDSLNPPVTQGPYCQIKVDYYDITSEVKVHLDKNYNSSINKFESLRDSPAIRRGVKRSFHDDSDSTNRKSSIPTPTSMIAGCLRKLKFGEGTKVTKTSSQSRYIHSYINDVNDLAGCEISYPTTPVKKVCRSSCHLESPSLRKPVKRLIIHSLSCDFEALQPVKQKSFSGRIRNYHIKPNKKIDIIKMLYEEGAMPPIMEIFKYLSNEDIYNFSLVSGVWLRVWDEVSKKLKQEFNKYLRNVKENQENKGTTPKDCNNSYLRVPMGVLNMTNSQVLNTLDVSPPGTPRTIRFKKFTKSASLDSRLQLTCVRCCQPAKVSKENSEEEWVECTNSNCSYQFCRFCKCDIHPGKKCLQYDLEGASPAKRKKSIYAVGTKKSKRNLRRLL